MTRILPINIQGSLLVNNIDLTATTKIFAHPNYKFYFYEDRDGILRFKNSIYGSGDGKAAYRERARKRENQKSQEDILPSSSDDKIDARIGQIVLDC